MTTPESMETRFRENFSIAEWMKQVTMDWEKIEDFVRQEVAIANREFLERILPEFKEDNFVDFFGCPVELTEEEREKVKLGWNACLAEIQGRSKELLK